MHTQRGMSMVGIVFVCIGLVIVAIAGLKIAPAYIEYFKVKQAVTSVVEGGEARGTVADIRKAFERRASVDDFKAVSGADLDIAKEGDEVVISFAYPQKIPLFGNISLLIDFAGSSKHR